MNPFFEKEVFPVDIHHTIINYLNNPAASSLSLIHIQMCIRDRSKDGTITTQGETIKKVRVDGKDFMGCLLYTSRCV